MTAQEIDSFVERLTDWLIGLAQTEGESIYTERLWAAIEAVKALKRESRPERYTKLGVNMKSRNADYSLLKIATKFKPVSHDRITGTCGNIQWDIGDASGGFKDQSAPMVLARLCALFNGLKIEVGGQEFYKTTWEVILEHTETGHIITLYDYKGGPSFGSDIYGEKTPKAFIRDVKKLLHVLSNERCPHPYDGCVVGEIA